MLLDDPVQEKALDQEWIELIFLAKMMGITIEEIRSFFRIMKSEQKKENNI